VVVPAPCVWVLLRGRGLLDLLEDLYIGLRWGVAVPVLTDDSSRESSTKAAAGGLFQSCDKRLVLISDSGVLSRLINTDQIFSS
jgi:hypothetical protein